MIGKKAPASDKTPLSPNDPNSFSNPEDVYVERYDIRWTVDFSSKKIIGSTTYNVVRRNSTAKFIILDSQDITIKSIVVKGTKKALEYTLGAQVQTFGKPLVIKLPETDKNHRCIFTIEYESPGSTCLLWLPRELTCDKTHPYMFSQGQAINFRSVMPCQDTPSTKATYSATVDAPTEFQVLMSALQTSAVVDGRLTTYKFEQSHPIPSYLIAIAVGRLANRKIGPRSTVYAEPSVINAAAYEFGDTERMLQIAEKIAGKYVWGEYNILVLPPSFPYGGMENPCMTFVTPALLAGDRSLTNVLAHEICHSWTGNLVTFKSYEHFWLSEGPTMYLERQVLAKMHGEAFRQFESILGMKELKECIMDFGPNTNATRLVPDLRGTDPDDIFSKIPYEKGYNFLYFLETKVGGSGLAFAANASVFLKFLRHYLEINKFKSPDSETFKKQFIDYFIKTKKEMIKDIEWDKWLYAPGMPIRENKYDDQLEKVCVDLKNRWMDWEPSKKASPFSAKDLDTFTMKSAQLESFLANILEDPAPFVVEKAKAMQACYNLNAIKNAEIRFRWLRLCIRAKWMDQLPLIFGFLKEYGRGKYIYPIYSALGEWNEARKQTIDLFNQQKSNMLPTTQRTIAKILKV